MLRVLMHPSPSRIKSEEDGISQVVLNYGKYAADYDIQYVEEGEQHDVVAVHAGMVRGIFGDNLVCHNHGLYWTGDRPGEPWEYKGNKNVIESLRAARLITVPSSWVAETIQRDMRTAPTVVNHGINFEEWQGGDLGNYVLWNKNRATVTCDPRDMNKLAARFPNVQFVSTFGNTASNVHITGKMKFSGMQEMVKDCAVYLATTKETGGIGIMEAMAAGKPILGYRTGAIVDLVKHGINGYLAEGIDDLYDGLVYCIDNAETLGENSRELAKEFTWQRAVEKVAGVYRLAAQKQKPTVSVIIPCYNYASMVGRAISSAIEQDYPDLEHIVVVDDGSTDNTKEAVAEWLEKDSRVRYIHQNNAGVANARNRGIDSVDSAYICCLDADDLILPHFLSACIGELENDRKLGAAYTKLRLISRDGTKEAKRASEWPTRFNYDAQIIGQNQIPTCCVYRREAWERLGGYRQRYAPKGCGSEDAEFWLRMGSIGYGAKLATEDPLFIYSFGGRTTGDVDYEEIDWLYWHPWARDALHPFASVATPERDSHPVLSYDNPLISVIIPVGPGHERDAINALDSLTAQSLRQWEGICVWDSEDTEVLEQYKKSFPFIRWVQTDGGEGAGYSRNRGAELARAPLLMFLDADDWFYPNMLERCIDEYSAQGGDVAIYTDSVGKALLDQETVDKAEQGKILYYDPKTKETVIAQKNKAYSWEKAVLQPNNADMYIWNYISTLHPKSWFHEVGGFDESMESWEDWDYWIRLAHKGKCFIHLEEELMVYPYFTGSRRQRGIDNWEKLIAYMKGKYEGVEMRPCRGCGSRRRSPPPQIPIRQTNVFQTAQRTNEVASFDFDGDMVMISYNSPNRGDHKVIGHAQFQYTVPNLRMVDVGGAYRVDYGYRKQGDRFLVHRREIEAAPHLFQPVSAAIPEIQIASQARRPQTRAPDRLVSNPLTGDELTGGDKEFDLQTIPGISADVAAQLRDQGIDMPEDIVELGIDGLKDIRGVGNRKAEVIIAAVQKRLEEIK